MFLQNDVKQIKENFTQTLPFRKKCNQKMMPQINSYMYLITKKNHQVLFCKLKIPRPPNHTC